MKTRKLLARLLGHLDSDARRRKSERKALQEILEKLKQKERRLSRELEEEPDDTRRVQLQHQVSVIRAQRKKGLKLLRDA
jgi:hypothetical protein